MSEPFLVARIVIDRILDDQLGDVVLVDATDGADEQLSLIESLGLLRMAEETVIRDR